MVAVVAMVLPDESLDDSTDAVSCLSLSVIDDDEIVVVAAPALPLPLVVEIVVASPLWSRLGADLETWLAVGAGADKR